MICIWEGVLNVIRIFFWTETLGELFNKKAHFYAKNWKQNNHPLREHRHLVCAAEVCNNSG